MLEVWGTLLTALLIRFYLQYVHTGQPQVMGTGAKVTHDTRSHVVLRMKESLFMRKQEVCRGGCGHMHKLLLEQ